MTDTLSKQQLLMEQWRKDKKARIDAMKMFEECTPIMQPTAPERVLMTLVEALQCEMKTIKRLLVETGNERNQILAGLEGKRPPPIDTNLPFDD